MPDSDQVTLDTSYFAPALSSLFTLALAVLLRDVSGVAGPGPAASILIVASAFIARMVRVRLAGNRSAGQPSGTVSYARAFALTLLASYAILSLSRPVPFADRFIP
ncbi:MAG: hypothetical protein ACOCRN_04550, partial [Spirochaetia bacterium]